MIPSTELERAAEEHASEHHNKMSTYQRNEWIAANHGFKSGARWAMERAGEQCCHWAGERTEKCDRCNALAADGESGVENG